MELRAPEVFRIYNWYQEHGYLEVAGRYDKKGCKCRLCGWENWDSGHKKLCPNCEAAYKQDEREGKFPLGLKHINHEDWLVLHAIDKQISLGEKPYATVEEYLEEIKEHEKHYRLWSEEQKRNETAHRANSTLY